MKMRSSGNRRRFFKQSLALTATLTLASACRRFQTKQDTGLDPHAIKLFGARFKGRLILPDDAEFDSARRIFFWNPETERRPAVIAVCAHEDDVIRAIEFARVHKLETAVRSGGHSYSGWSTCNGLLIDLARLNSVSIDPVKRIARGGGGALATEFRAPAARHDLAPILGDCDSVGAAGVTVGGGLSTLSGLHGAACDNLLAATLITAEGDRLIADQSHNADLFWAIRGGGGNFGIVTELVHRLHPVREMLVGELNYRPEDLRAVLRTYRDLMAVAPDPLQIDLSISPKSDSFKLIISYAGNSAEGERAIRPLRTIAKPLSDTLKPSTWSALHSSNEPRQVRSISPNYLSVKGVYVAQLSDTAIDLIIDHIAQGPAGVVIGGGHPMHGAVCRVSPNETAFDLRQPGSVHLYVAAGWPISTDATAQLTWVDQTWHLLRAHSAGRIYSNFQTFNGKGAAQAVFGSNYQRLQTIKRKYDSVNFFRRNSNLGPIS